MSTARERILNAVRANQPASIALPEIIIPASDIGLPAKFTETLTNIGGKVIVVDGYENIISYLEEATNNGLLNISSIPQLHELKTLDHTPRLPHSLQDAELAIIKAQFGVAENGAVWITEEVLSQRVLPFICQHLMVILNADGIVANMHQAYDQIGMESYGYGTFIAGPSKTADIEQSLVLGAHGSRSMTIFLINP
jgi:L-lactate dehydrogenase complex protein LldG